MIKKPYLYSEGQQGAYFNRYILVRQIFTTILSCVFIVFTSYFITNFTILGNGLTGYETWNGMLILNIVVITVNLRILNMSSQVSFVLALLCIFGVATYYLLFFLI